MIVILIVHSKGLVCKVPIQSGVPVKVSPRVPESCDATPKSDDCDNLWYSSYGELIVKEESVLTSKLNFAFICDENICSFYIP